MTDSHNEAPATPHNRTPAGILRWKLTRWTLTAAILMLATAWWIDGKENSNLVYLENFSWIVGIAMSFMGLWLLVFGKIHFFWLIDIDLKQERPAFRVGVALFNIHVSETWTKGCFRIRRTNMYLVVPTMVRLLVLGYLCYVLFGVLDDRYVKLGSFAGTCLFGLAAWVTHKKWFPGTPNPIAITETAMDATPATDSAGVDARAASDATGDIDVADAAD